MKKLILSMFIVLGTIASVQAQSLSFSCGIEDTGETVRSSINDAPISVAQLATLNVADFIVGGNTGQESLRKTTPVAQFYIAYGSFYYGGADGLQFGPFAYKVNAQFISLARRGGISYHQNADYAIAALLQL